MTSNPAEKLIERYVELDPLRPGKSEARLKEHHISVWALAGYFQEGNSDLERAARDFGLPREAVEAAFEFYKRHRAIIDDRVAANAL